MSESTPFNLILLWLSILMVKHLDNGEGVFYQIVGPHNWFDCPIERRLVQTIWAFSDFQINPWAIFGMRKSSIMPSDHIRANE